MTSLKGLTFFTAGASRGIAFAGALKVVRDGAEISTIITPRLTSSPIYS